MEGVPDTQALGKVRSSFHPLPFPPSLELLPKGSKEEQRDYVFYLAVGNYRLKVRQIAPFPTPPYLGGPPASSHFSTRGEPWPLGRPKRAMGRGYRGAG